MTTFNAHKPKRKATEFKCADDIEQPLQRLKISSQEYESNDINTETYFDLPPINNRINHSIIVHNNKFNINGKPYEWTSGVGDLVTSYYWRCQKYHSLKCLGRIRTHKYDNSDEQQPFGHIDYIGDQSFVCKL